MKGLEKYIPDSAYGSFFALKGGKSAADKRVHPEGVFTLQKHP